MMILAVFALAAMAAAPAPVEKPGKTFSLHVPDELSPALDPYVTCRLQSVGAQMKGADGKPKPVLAEKGGDCSAIRVKAVADADALLVKKGESDARRAKTIAKTVKSIDDFAEMMKGVMAAAEKK